MNYTVELKILIEGFRATSFKEIRTTRDKLDDEIHKWIHRKRMEFGYRDFEILSVMVNDSEDLTDIFK